MQWPYTTILKLMSTPVSFALSFFPATSLEQRVLYAFRPISLQFQPQDLV